MIMSPFVYMAFCHHGTKLAVATCLPHGFDRDLRKAPQSCGVKLWDDGDSGSSVSSGCAVRFRVDAAF